MKANGFVTRVANKKRHLCSGWWLLWSSRMGWWVVTTTIFEWLFNLWSKMWMNYRIVTVDNLLIKDKPSIEVPSVTCFGLVTCRMQGWQLETGCPLRKLKLKLKLKLVLVIRCSSVCSKTFSEDDTLSGRNRFQTMIFLPEYPFRKSSPKIWFSYSKFDILQRLSNFQEIRENILQRLLISKKPSSMAFQFLQRLSNNIIFQSWKLCVRTNRHSPHSLASVKDMYVEMGFQLNLYQQHHTRPSLALAPIHCYDV